MKTTVMFINQSVPLAGRPVRVVGGDDTIHVTDEEGKVELDLREGSLTFEIDVGDGGDWLRRTVEHHGSSPLFIVDVSRRQQESMSTLNTVQIELSNLVGDRFVFETVLGRGGMGVVVKAVDRMLNRPVAIKMLSDELRENEEAQQIFMLEARNLATLSHPNLVAIHDILNVDGRVLMIFEYVLGQNLEARIKQEGALDPKDVLRIAIQLTRVVAYLHEHELIHRDLKPSNVIIQADGTLKLIDFGLARSLNELYVRGTRLRGTPAYMAPEQVQGIHLTVATDIYQIGISLFEALAGRLPFSSGDLAYAHVHREPPDIRQIVPGIDERLADLVEACLAKTPRDRPPTAQALLESLQDVYARITTDQSLDEIPGTADLPEIPEFVEAEPSIVDVEELAFGEDPVQPAPTSREALLLAAAALGIVGLAAVFIVPALFDEEDTAVKIGNAEASVQGSAEAERAAPAPAESADGGTEPAESTSPQLEAAVEASARELDVAHERALGTVRENADAVEGVPAARLPRTAPSTKRAKRATKTRPPPEKKTVPTPKAEAPATEQPAPEAEESDETDLLSVDDEDDDTLLPVD